MIKCVGRSIVVGVVLVLAASAGWADDGAGEAATTEPALPGLQAGQVDVAMETATHEELEPLDVQFEDLSALRLDHRGRLLACDAGTGEIKVINSGGQQIATISLEFGPQAIDVASDGKIYCGGEGQLAILDAAGNLLKTATTPDGATSQMDSRRRMMDRPVRVSGIAVSQHNVLVAYGSGWSMGSKSKLYRFDRNLENPELLAEGLRGCCQRCDLVAGGDLFYLAENAVHRVVAYDASGNVIDKWGERSRTEVEGFGSCCNPMNLCFDGQGVLYTAESGMGRVKRYSTDGQYLGLVGYVGVERFTNAGRTAASCSNIAIAVTADGKRVYVMDYKNKLIRVLQQKEEPKHEQPSLRPRRGLRLLGDRIRRILSRGRIGSGG